MERVFVHGSAVTTTWADTAKSLQDLIFDCVSLALADAGIAAADLEAVVLGAHDLVDGRGLTNMVTAPAAAAYLKDETRLGDDGAAAFVLADARVRSGSVRNCLVAAWGRASEGPVDDISRALFDPFTTRPLGMTEIGVSGLRATRALVDHPGYAEHRDAAAARRLGSDPRVTHFEPASHAFRTAPADPGRASDPADPGRTSAPADAGRTSAPPWPLRSAELPVWSDVVAAVVLSADPSSVEVLGVGMGTEPFELGDRDLLGLPALRSAAAQALAEAGCAITDVEVLELDGLTLFDEALALEAVGAAAPGAGMDGCATDPRLDPAGATAVGYCAPAMGLVRIARAGRRLAEHGSGRALASGSSVVAAQSQAAVVLGAPAGSVSAEGKS
jgi:acetyl-CoA C-acetyltransferase